MTEEERLDMLADHYRGFMSDNKENKKKDRAVWLENLDGAPGYMCSKCEAIFDSTTPFCPNCKSPMEKEVDMVNEPPHYKTDKGFECIDVIEVSLGKKGCIDFCLGNALKYLFRCKKKHDNSIEDLKKAKWYIDEANRRLDLLEKYGDD